MGKLTKSLLLHHGLMCGTGRYQPFDDDCGHEEAVEGGGGRAAEGGHVQEEEKVKYNCEQCGHRGAVKVRRIYT
jgi:DNA-directed RNA polymerase subunit RPC12/RpoP